MELLNREVVIAIVLMALLEHALPYHRQWNTPQHDIGTDTLHMLVSQLGVGRLFDALMLGLLVHLFGSAI